jgi:putative tricarboxylic transport membrane protein
MKTKQQMAVRTCAVVAAALMLVSGHASAQGFKPTRNVDFVVHTGPGGGSDVFARTMIQILESEKLVPVRMHVLNKPGAGGAAAMAYTAEKKGDPHTLAIFTTIWMTLAITSAEVRVKFSDLTPIANLIFDSELAVVKTDSPYRTFEDFIEAAKKSPKQLRQAGGSVESRANLVRQLLQRTTGATWQYIPFPGGGERLAALLGGHVQLLIIGPEEIREHLSAGSIRPIAQVAEKRLASYPNVPTMQELYKLPSVRTLRGIAAPPSVSKEAVEYWEGVFSRMVKTKAWRKYLADAEAEDGYIRAAEVPKLNEDILAQRRQLFSEAGIKTAR